MKGSWKRLDRVLLAFGFLGMATVGVGCMVDVRVVIVTGAVIGCVAGTFLVFRGMWDWVDSREV